MAWNNYSDSNKAFTVILFNNAAFCIRSYLAVPIPSLNEYFAFYDELQKQLMTKLNDINAADVKS
jgi:hypothetical protein